MFFRKIVLPVVNAAFKGHQQRLNLTKNEFQRAKDLYEKGKKAEALEIFESLAKKNHSDKASRGMIATILDDAEHERKEQPSNKSKTK